MSKPGGGFGSLPLLHLWEVLEGEMKIFLITALVSFSLAVALHEFWEG